MDNKPFVCWCTWVSTECVEMMVASYCTWEFNKRKRGAISKRIIATLYTFRYFDSFQFSAIIERNCAGCGTCTQRGYFCKILKLHKVLYCLIVIKRSPNSAAILLELSLRAIVKSSSLMSSNISHQHLQVNAALRVVLH